MQEEPREVARRRAIAEAEGRADALEREVAALRARVAALQARLVDEHEAREQAALRHAPMGVLRPRDPNAGDPWRPEPPRPPQPRIIRGLERGPLLFDPRPARVYIDVGRSQGLAVGARFAAFALAPGGQRPQTAILRVVKAYDDLSECEVLAMPGPHLVTRDDLVERLR